MYIKTVKSGPRRLKKWFSGVRLSFGYISSVYIEKPLFEAIESFLATEHAFFEGKNPSSLLIRISVLTMYAKHLASESM